ncbi:heme-binding protein [Phormidium sp. CCY1219]|uniref:heme-binding protein n=1 Tax=Phormidium sp. CCY1219 TaxID=2886104 RepID=UPI002D1EA1E9|nr:heme-binding protein [Phormidium sp. CCY1219]MEB3826052.1 heme-binding protein [Phormidium sp. CCY1219]
MSASLPKGFPKPTEPEAIAVKDYPGYRAVTYTYQGQVQQATRVAFDPLYNHISRNQIAMTTPVEVRYTDASAIQVETPSQAEVSFLYPDREIEPQNIGSDVKVTDYPPMKVVSIGIQGAYSWSSYETHLQRLQGWLQAHPEYKAVGCPRRLLYNSPMTPEPLKRSEVQIAIAPVD